MSDELCSLLSDGMKVDPTSLGIHPRYALHKNAGRAASQQARRRQEAIDRQDTRRWDHHNHIRKLAENDFDSDDEVMDDAEVAAAVTTVQSDEPQDLSKPKQKNYKPRYADELMLSEWLVDIPESLSQDWIMVAAPIGKRCLVVSSRGVTSAYNKGGKLLQQFSCDLFTKGQFTILDCILSDKIFYCLDVLAWAGTAQTENPFDFRRFFLNSRLQDNPSISEPSNRRKFAFRSLPQTICSKAGMTSMLSEPFDFDLDGLLFYYSLLQYEAGQNPLIGWLKPWMMPELLDVPVHDKYLAGNSEKQTSSQFISDYNKKHNHVTKIGQHDMTLDPQP